MDEYISLLQNQYCILSLDPASQGCKQPDRASK